MNGQQLINEIFTKKTFLCVGLDTDNQQDTSTLEE